MHFEHICGFLASAAKPQTEVHMCTRVHSRVHGEETNYVAVGQLHIALAKD